MPEVHPQERPDPSELFTALAQLVDESAAAGRPALAGWLKSQLLQRWPGRSTDATLQSFSTFRSFLHAAAEQGYVRIAPDSEHDLAVVPAGQDPIPKDTKRSAHTDANVPESSRRIRADLWRAFTAQDPALIRVFDKSSGEALTFSERPGASDRSGEKDGRERWLVGDSDLVEIPGIPVGEQLEWARDFAKELQPPGRATAIALALHHENPLAAFDEAVRGDPVIRGEWNPLKRDRVEQAIRDWIASSQLELSIYDDRPTQPQEGALKAKQAATSRRPGARPRQRELSRELYEAQQQLDRATTRASQAERTARDLRKELKKVEGLLEQATGRDSSDVETTFHCSLTEEWCKALTPTDRRAWPLGPYSLGDDFLANLRAVEGAPLTRVARVCALVLCGRAHNLEPHALRSGSGPRSSQRTRESDGARAWRCAIKKGMSSSPRLHYWTLADGSIEFANVVTHDEFRISG